MWPRVSQICRTLLFYIHFSQIRYQIKSKYANAYGQANIIILVSSIFEVNLYISGEAKLFLGEIS